jgi:hypothetical protein
MTHYTDQEWGVLTWLEATPWVELHPRTNGEMRMCVSQTELMLLWSSNFLRKLRIPDDDVVGIVTGELKEHGDNRTRYSG